MISSKEMQTFLKQARTCDEPSAEKGEALRALVDGRIAAAEAASAAQPKTGKRLLVVRLAVPMACIAVLASALYVAGARSRGPVAPAPMVTVTPEPVRSEAPSSAPSPSTSPSPPPPSVAASEPAIDVRTLPDAPKPADSAVDSIEAIDRSLEIETRILREARAARVAGVPDRSLALVSEHAARFPNGALAPERDAERISALCALGRVEEARWRIDAFERHWPSSALLGRVRTSCRGTP